MPTRPGSSENPKAADLARVLNHWKRGQASDADVARMIDSMTRASIREMTPPPRQQESQAGNGEAPKARQRGPGRPPKDRSGQ